MATTESMRHFAEKVENMWAVLVENVEEMIGFVEAMVENNFVAEETIGNSLL